MRLRGYETVALQTETNHPVMAGLDPAIHAAEMYKFIQLLDVVLQKASMAGSSPAMTVSLQIGANIRQLPGGNVMIVPALARLALSGGIRP